MIFCLHHTLSANSRAVRVQLAEKGQAFQLKAVAPWKRDPDFLGLNPAGDAPVLLHDKNVIAGVYPIFEYIEETFSEPSLLSGCAVSRAETRRLVDWFLRKFQEEVTYPLVGEKIIKRIASLGAPSSKSISAGRINIHTHLEYIAWLMERRNWLAGEAFSLADIAAAAQISLVDFSGEVPWSRHPSAKDWYARVKSRPSFRPLLADKVIGIVPPSHYTNLDF